MYVLISRSSHGLSNLKPNYVTEGKKQMLFFVDEEWEHFPMEKTKLAENVN